MGVNSNLKFVLHDRGIWVSEMQKQRVRQKKQQI